MTLKNLETLNQGDDVQLMGVGVVSDDGKSIEIVSIEDQEIGDDDSDDENETEEETESPKQETETEEAEELAEGADIGSIIASGFGA